MFELYFGDLTPAAQRRLLEAANVSSPKEMNWDMDIIPIAVFEDFEGGAKEEK